MKIQQNIRYLLKIKQMAGCLAKCSSFKVKPTPLWFAKWVPVFTQLSPATSYAMAEFLGTIHVTGRSAP